MVILKFYNKVYSRGLNLPIMKTAQTSGHFLGYSLHDKLPFVVNSCPAAFSAIFSREDCDPKAIWNLVVLLEDTDDSSMPPDSFIQFVQDKQFERWPVYLVSCMRACKLMTRPNKSQDFLSNVQRLSVPDSVENIADRCFCYSELSFLTFGEASQLKRIHHAFSGYLRHIRIPDRVEKLCERCFDWSVLLRTVVFSESSQLKVIGTCALSNCAALREIWIPGSVTQLCDRCFYECKDLRRVSFCEPSSLKCIKREAFSRSALGEIRIPDSVEELSDACFSYCWQLSRVSFGVSSRVKRIGIGTFSFCLLKEIHIPDHVLELADECFQWTRIHRVTFGQFSSLRRIGRGCFANCSLIQFSIPSTVVSIGGGAFSGSPLTDGFNCEENCHFFVSGSLLLGKSGRVCYGMLGTMSEVQIPDSVEELCERCFMWCCDLVNVTFGESPCLKRIGPLCFAFTKLVHFALPASVVSIGGGVFSRCPLNGGLSCDENHNFFLSDSLLLGNSGRICCGSIGFVEEVRIPDTVEEIHDYCFAFWEVLGVCTFGNGSALKRIGVDAFYQTGIMDLVLPAGVEELCEGCFRDCLYLRSVSFDVPGRGETETVDKKCNVM